MSFLQNQAYLTAVSFGHKYLKPKTSITKEFATIRKDRSELNGGGLLLFIHNELNFEQF